MGFFCAATLSTHILIILKMEMKGMNIAKKSIINRIFEVGYMFFFLLLVLGVLILI